MSPGDSSLPGIRAFSRCAAGAIESFDRALSDERVEDAIGNGSLAIDEIAAMIASLGDLMEKP